MLSNRMFVDSLLFSLVQLGSWTWWFDVICLVNQMCTSIWKCFPHYTENESGFLLRWFCEISPCLLVMSIKHCKRCRSFIRTGTSLVKWLVCHLGSRGPRLLLPTTTTLVVEGPKLLLTRVLLLRHRRDSLQRAPNKTCNFFHEFAL